MFRRRKKQESKYERLRKELLSIDIQEAVWTALELAGLEPAEYSGEEALYVVHTFLSKHDPDSPFVSWFKSADSEELSIFLEGWDRLIAFHTSPHPDDPLRKLSMAGRRVEVISRAWRELEKRRISPMCLNASSALKFARAMARIDPRSITADWLKAADEDEHVKFTYEWEDCRVRRAQEGQTEEDRFAELAGLYHARASSSMGHTYQARISQLEKELGEEEASIAYKWASRFTGSIQQA